MARTAPSPQTSETPEAVPQSAPLLASEEAHASLIDTMKEYFKTEARDEVRILGDAKDGDVFVQINGYSFLIQRGVKVRVPRSVRTLLEDGGYI